MRVLVVPRGSDLKATVSELSRAGFQLTLAASYREARDMLSAARPAALVTDLQLGDHNGLQLVLRGRGAHPTLACIVVSEWPDAVLEDDAKRMGATFMVKPVAPGDLLAAVMRTISAGGAVPVSEPFERRATERRAQTMAVAHDRRGGERRDPSSIGRVHESGSRKLS